MNRDMVLYELFNPMKHVVKSNLNILLGKIDLLFTIC